MCCLFKLYAVVSEWLYFKTHWYYEHTIKFMIIRITIFSLVLRFIILVNPFDFSIVILGFQ